MEEFGGKVIAFAVALFVILFIVIGVMPVRWTMVQPTEVGVLIKKGTFGGGHGVDPEPLAVGIHYYNHWTTDIVKYKISARAFPSQSMASENEKQYNMELKTNDGQNVSVDMTIIYSLNAKEVPMLHQQIGQAYEDQILLPQVRSEARLAIGSYSAEDIYQGKVRDEIQTVIKQKLALVLSKYPAIQIQDALLRHFAFSEQFEGAIEAKKLAAQQVEIFKNKALAQEQEAKRQEAEARGGKLKAVQEAEGRAESVKIEADAERHKLEQEALGQLAKYKADAEGKRLSAEALGGGQNVVALKFAESLPEHLQVWGIPTGGNSSSIMDLSGVFGKMFEKKAS